MKILVAQLVANFTGRIVDLNFCLIPPSDYNKEEVYCILAPTCSIIWPLGPFIKKIGPQDQGSDKLNVAASKIKQVKAAPKDCKLKKNLNSYKSAENSLEEKNLNNLQQIFRSCSHIMAPEAIL